MSEVLFLRKPIISLIPEIPGVPIRKQAYPLPDPYQIHIGVPQVAEMSGRDGPVNMLPYGHFYGTSIPQINQPQFLGVNEKR